jgi:arylesterase/paraoxonase
MNRTVTITLLVVLGLALIVGLYVLRLFIDMGQFTTIKPHFAGTCERYHGVVGAEDVEIDRLTGRVYISATDRRAVMAGGDVRGELYVMDLHAPENGFTPITGGVPADFRPHGLSLWRDADGVVRRLFVVSHPAQGDSRVEIYEVMETRAGLELTHVRTVIHPLILSPNDVVAVGPDAFYITNDHAHKDGFMRTVEDYLRLSRTTVVYHDGVQTRVVAEGLTYANGINVSHDGRTIYVTETTDRVLRIYDRDIETGELTQRPGAEGYVWIGTGLDNIDVDAEGNLWIGAHPKMFDFIAHANDPDKIAPSQILKVTFDPETPYGSIDEVYLNLGEEISGSSVAAVHEGRMVIGSVFEPFILVCELPEEYGRLRAWQERMGLTE